MVGAAAFFGGGAPAQASFHLMSIREVATNPAGANSAYIELQSGLFRNQETWADNGKIEEALSTVFTPAELVKVRALIKDPKMSAEMEQDMALGAQAKIRQTPTMIVTSKGKVYPIPGNVTYSILRKFLDDLLTAK